MRVYLYLVRNGPCELREVQRGLGLSTPSLASYHLNRLISVGYAKQDEQGRYLSLNESSTRILEGYSTVGGAIVPQLLFFAVLFTMLTSFFSYEALFGAGFAPYLVIVAAAMVVALWYETFRLWRRLVAA